ncbi:DUF3426 domain-containing protein [Stenotrophomonas pigmentata]|uniref:DUF3426 domain-containing protein n=1 Tax=Stenotrophomonas pigmentata TaxID=3055080 RepID=UPI0031F306FE
MTDETAPTQPSLATFLQGPAKPSTPKQGTPEGAPAAAASDDTQATLALDLPSQADQAEPVQADVERAGVTQAELEHVEVERAEVEPAAAEHVAAEHAEVPQLEAAQPELVLPQAAVIGGNAGSEDTEPTEDSASSAVLAPSFARANRAHAAAPADTPRWQWGLVLALALLLGLQIILADRAKLAADAGTRPLVSGLCSVLRCSLPPWHEPSAYSMLSRDIRPVPGQAGALQVQTSFRNDARWAQAWPALRLSLSDADGRVIGRRTLQPAEYLGAGADPLARLEPGQSAQVSFRLREPAAATVAFSFEFQ